jgi:hypothetical protein
VVDGPDESGAECYAIAHMLRTLLLLGVDQDHAAELTEIYRDRVHPGMPPAYTQPC